jgi:hypothetical protein
MTINITVTNSRVLVSGVETLRLQDVLYEAPENNRDEHGGLRPSMANILYLHDLYPDANWHDPNNRLVEARAYRFVDRLRSAEPGDYERNFPFKTACDPHQLKVFTYARRMKNIALSPAALGTGKTKMALDIAADKFLRDEIDVLVVIAPNNVYRQWVLKAVPVHLSDSVPRLCHTFKAGKRVPNNILANEPGVNHRRLRIVTFNVEAFSKRGSPAELFIRELCARHRVMLAVDESTRIKNWKAKRTKNIIRLRALAVSRIIMTGNPVTKSLNDFYSQFEFLDPAILGFSNFFAYRNRYCQLVPIPRAPPGALRIVGYRNQEELIRKIAPVSFMIPDTVLGLPPKRYERIVVDMTPEQAEIYDMMARQLVEELQQRRIVNPTNVMARITRLQQVLSGRYYESVYDTVEEAVQHTPIQLPNNRPIRLAEILEDQDGQAIIWARYRDDVDDIVGEIGGLGRVGIFDGRITSLRDREATLAAFIAGDLDWLVANPAVGGTGVDGLQARCFMNYYYSHSFNYEDRYQSEGRTFRRGQTQSVYYGDFCVEGTVDTLFLNNLAEKAELGRMLINNPLLLRRDANAVV